MPLNEPNEHFLPRPIPLLDLCMLCPVVRQGSPPLVQGQHVTVDAYPTWQTENTTGPLSPGWFLL